jgi:hypothetical protein
MYGFGDEKLVINYEKQFFSSVPFLVRCEYKQNPYSANADFYLRFV